MPDLTAEIAECAEKIEIGRHRMEERRRRSLIATTIQATSNHDPFAFLRELRDLSG